MEAVEHEPVRLMEIERELAGPDSRDALARHDAILVQLAQRLDAAINAGVTPDEFQRLAELKEANIIARKILRLAVKVDSETQKA